MPITTQNYKSIFGTDIVELVSLGDDTNEYIDIFGAKYSFKKINLENCLISDFIAVKKIIYETVQGQDGTTKDYIALDDFSFILSGVIISYDGKYPENDIVNIANMFKYPIHISITSNYLNNIWGINNVVIKQVSAPQIIGSQSRQEIQISCVSDVQQSIKNIPKNSITR